MYANCIPLWEVLHSGGLLSQARAVNIPTGETSGVKSS